MEPKNKSKISPKSTKGFSDLYSKTDVRYWRQKLVKRSGNDWTARISYQGKQTWFPLRTPNKDSAAAKARDIYLSLQSDGWDATLMRHKPWVNGTPPPLEVASVGEFINAAKAVSEAKPATTEVYAKKLRNLVAGIMGIRPTQSRYNYVHGGTAAWREKIEATSLSELTPDAIQRWRIKKLQQATDPLQKQRTEITVSSILRAGKSLFKPSIVEQVSKVLTLPDPIPFAGVSPGKATTRRYKSRVNPALLFKQAQLELQENDPPLFHIFLLALFAGLSREEIDTLQWQQINFGTGTISVETTQYGATKTAAREDEVDVDRAILAMIRPHMEKATSPFVIPAISEPRPNATYHHYRCARTFKRLMKWLRSKGVNDQKPLHTLRKEFGNLINKRAGIFAASAALRHSGIQITRDSYLDKNVRVHELD